MNSENTVILVPNRINKDLAQEKYELQVIDIDEGDLK